MKENVLVALSAILLSICSPISALSQTWWNTYWNYRVPLTVGANGHARSDMPVEAAINFTALFSQLGSPQTLDTNSIRVIEYSSSGQIQDTSVIFQFDKDSTFNSQSNASGVIVILLSGTTTSSQTRYFQIYFDASGRTFTRPAFSSPLQIADNIAYQGQSSYRIETPRATYYYHKLGGGFASMIDANNRDWISYRPGGGSAGEYRGIPNLGVCAHPGYTNATSIVTSQGPLRISISSQTTDGNWSWQWSIFPSHARMTLTRAAAPYWILYEGTPGGQLDVSSDYWVQSSRSRQNVSQTWFGDIPTPEWAYFGDASLRRVLFLAHHQDDGLEDQFYQMENNMTVFGFGRRYQCCDRLLTAIPMNLTIGFVEDSSLASVEQQINSAQKDLTIILGNPILSSAGEQSKGKPEFFSLEQNYPNPFNPRTMINFGLPARTYVTLTIYDMLGRETENIFSGELEGGFHRREWDASNVASGVYYYRLTAGNLISTRKLVLLR